MHTWYKWCDWLTSHIAESVKKFLSDAKEKVMELFEANKDNKIPKYCQPNKITGTFDDKYIEYKSEGNEKH